ncbi:unnamed protein product [Mucor fragilis]
MERFTRNKALTMLLATIFLLSLLALLSNITPIQSRSLFSGSQDSADTITTNTQIQQGESDLDVPDEEDLVPVSTKPIDAKEWQPKKWGRLSPEIEQAIEYNVRVAGGSGSRKADRILLTAVANQGMADYTMNWIASLKKCKLDDKFLVFAIDEEMVETMKKAGFGKHVVMIPKDWFHKELSKDFEGWLSDGYTPITHSKSLVVERLLYTDVTVWFSDVDIVFTSPSIYDYLLMKLNSRNKQRLCFPKRPSKKSSTLGSTLCVPQTQTNVYWTPPSTFKIPSRTKSLKSPNNEPSTESWMT